ncbi:MAG: epimerase [Verrucomicrobia bacterium]|nr:MAG: epimerase [Verrucomicrobiota bacterium]
MNPLTSDLDFVLTQGRSLWEELRGSRLFITGGTGFFGCWLLETFAWANEKLGLGASATVLTRSVEAFQKKAPHLAKIPSIRFQPGDIRTFEFPPGRFSHIIHAATEASAKLNEENPLLMFDTIVEGTRRALEFARQCGAQRFLLASSGAVYGQQPSDITHVPEDYGGGPNPTEPRWAYGEGKRAAELLCALYHKQTPELKPTIARCFAFVGPHLPLDMHFAIGNFIRDGLGGGPIEVNGDGTPFRSYLYAADLALWLWTILLKGQSCRPYNVGSDKDLTVAETACAVADAFQPPVEVRIARQPTPGKPAERYVPSAKRAQVELGLKENFGLSQAIQRTIAWHREGNL